MADATATALAQLFQLDLSACSTDEACSQLVINTVQEMGNNMHEMNQKLNELGVTDFNGEETEIEPKQETVKEEAKAAPAVAASLEPKFSNAVIKGVAKGRIGEVRELVANGYLLPAAGKKLLDRYASDKAIGLSLSMEESDGYEETLDVIRANGPVVVLGEQSGRQSNLQTLQQLGDIELSYDDIKDETKNPLLADAASRSKK